MKKLYARKVKSVVFEFRDWHDDKDTYIALSEWVNGEGVDIHVSDDKGVEKHISLSHGEMDALTVAAGRFRLPEQEGE